MARVNLSITHGANRLTLKTMLEAEGHQVVEDAPDVIVTDDLRAAVEAAKVSPVLALVAVADVKDAVRAMRQGVYGYVLVPFQPGEAAVMVERAVGARNVGVVSDWPSETLAAVEARHILATLRHCRHNQAETARVLGIGRNTLWRKLKQIRESEVLDATEIAMQVNTRSGGEPRDPK